MKLTTDQVKKVAKLANLPITENEEEKYAEQLSAILDYIDQLNSVDTKNVDPTYNVTGLDSIFRPDQVGESLTQEEALKNGSNVRDGYFVTKGVFESE
jgi:aspartyl-tRNA(Asn)/glutamyl-tRNA(Gln) amidotransferase subunit C